MANDAQWENSEVGCESLSELQEVLLIDDHSHIQNNAQLRSYIEVMERRLEHVHRWGWPYSEIEMSPHMKALSLLSRVEERIEAKEDNTRGNKQLMVS